LAEVEEKELRKALEWDIFFGQTMLDEASRELETDWNEN
jgi:hypothetical protein